MQGLIHPGTLTPYDIAIAHILDLTDAVTVRSLGIESGFFTLPWRAIRDLEQREPESWLFATQAAAAGFWGIKVPSAVRPGVNLVLWRWNEQPGEVVVVDPLGELS